MQVSAGERDEPLLQRQRAVGDQFFPVGAPHIDLVVDAVDRRFVAREVAVQQRPGDTDLSRVLPGKPCVAKC
ncbi:hypothetical protein WS67_01530 [Burkholderia singularis]|uniref:Uncharacterized protein n=1 Tax=Burkholderia singularis TaxID=1503053 RepID=A0A118DM35_9BURK|nr:hypothetical protein WS67_01530 [Burkholderia singularis]